MMLDIAYAMGRGGSTGQGAGTSSLIPALIFLAIIGWGFARIARKQGKSFWLYFLVGMIPFISIVALFVLGNKEKPICPKCGKKIPQGAKGCEYCGHLFNEIGPHGPDEISEKNEGISWTREILEEKMKPLSKSEKTIKSEENKKAPLQANKKSMEGLESLFEDLEGGRKKAKIKAAESLGELRRAEAVPRLVQQLEDVKTDGEVCIAIVNALGKIGDEKAIEALVRAISDFTNNIRGKKDLVGLMGISVRMAATHALAGIGKPALKALIKTLESGNSIGAQSAAEALGIIGADEAIESLIMALKPNAAGQSAALALERIGEPAVESLKRAVDSEDEYVKRQAVKIINKIAV
jgi:HEAT repeat protein/ribosomal protein L40E